VWTRRARTRSPRLGSITYSADARPRERPARQGKVFRGGVLEPRKCPCIEEELDVLRGTHGFSPNGPESKDGICPSNQDICRSFLMFPDDPSVHPGRSDLDRRHEKSLPPPLEDLVRQSRDSTCLSTNVGTSASRTVWPLQHGTGSLGLTWISPRNDRRRSRPLRTSSD